MEYYLAVNKLQYEICRQMDVTRKVPDIILSKLTQMQKENMVCTHLEVGISC